MASVGGVLSSDVRLVKAPPLTSPTQVYLVSSKDIVTNRDVSRAIFHQEGTQITFTDEGMRRLKAYAKNNAGQQVAIMVDSIVFSAPVVQLPIDNPVTISTLEREQAHVLTMVVRLGALGALPVRLIPLEENTLQPKIKRLS